MSHTADPDPTVEEDGDFWSIQRTAEEWDVSVKTIRREIDSGALRVVRIGPKGGRYAPHGRHAQRISPRAGCETRVHL